MLAVLAMLAHASEEMRVMLAMLMLAVKPRLQVPVPPKPVLLI